MNAAPMSCSVSNGTKGKHIPYWSKVPAHHADMLTSASKRKGRAKEFREARGLVRTFEKRAFRRDLAAHGY